MPDAGDGQPAGPSATRHGFTLAGVLLACAIGYWLMLFTGTHLPRVPKAFAEQSDKVLHLAGYGGLAAVLLFWRLSRGPVGLRSLALLWIVIACYGAFDEVTQPIVGRFCDFGDWVADVTGAAVALAIVWMGSKLILPADRMKPTDG
jgi:VanZ family protein